MALYQLLKFFTRKKVCEWNSAKSGFFSLSKHLSHVERSDHIKRCLKSHKVEFWQLLHWPRRGEFGIRTVISLWIFVNLARHRRISSPIKDHKNQRAVRRKEKNRILEFYVFCEQRFSLSKNIDSDKLLSRLMKISSEWGEGRPCSVEGHQVIATQHFTTTEADTGERGHWLPRPFSRVYIISVLQVPGFWWTDKILSQQPNLVIVYRKQFPGRWEPNFFIFCPWRQTLILAHY